MNAVQRPPWSLRLAGIVWALAGLLFALGPVLAVVLQQLQYASLRRQVFGAAGLADTLDPSEMLDVRSYLAEYERWEGIISDVLGPFVLPLVIGYACVAAILLVAYFVLSWWTSRGENWARITGTVLSVASAPVLLTVWLFVVGFEWLPLNALRANSIGLVIVALHVAGLVLAWLPASNAYVRARRAARVIHPAMR